MRTRRHFIARLAGIILLTFGVAARAQNAGILAGPPPGWVSPLTVAARAASVANGPEAWRYLLRDRQINVRLRQVYAHDVMQALTVEGATNVGEIEVDFDPSYQTLAVHWLRLEHNGVVVNVLNTGQIAAAPKPPQEQGPLFGESQTAHILVAGVQPGDVVDCAYTISGQNPILRGLWFSEAPAQMPVPALRLRTRLLWPTNRTMFDKDYLTSIQARATPAGANTEYSWDLANVPGLDVESNLPPGYDPYPRAQISGLRLWSEVNAWALGLFTNNAALSAGLTGQIETWRRLRSQAAETAAVLRFVQDEIRTVLETGAGPAGLASPGAVFDRRYGDGLEKALLFCAALRGLGIECYPALVNTVERQTINQWAPTPLAFNDALAAAVVDGGEYWLDPTASYQRGPLGQMAYPDCGYALLVTPRTVALTPMPPSGDRPETTVTESFDVGRPDQAVTFKSVTIASGSDAAAIRRQFATMAPGGVEKASIDSLAKDYPQIEETAPAAFHDNEQANTVEVDRFYRFSGSWLDPTNVGGWYSLRIHPHNVEAYLPKAGRGARTMPWAIPYPIHQVYKAEITLHARIYTTSGTLAVRDPAFYLGWSASFPDNGHIVTENDLETLSSAVMPSGYAAYEGSLQQASGLMGIVLGFYPE